ncbi:hypothetical protein ElyMa_007057200 [Elysia marginata]|uniref:Uncharacterized protein n=1 Tax=Elysia marginata TaxID=1093978 RepID=A0AAV4JW23_9GAST|nr:hypothetical protein ElyMa_007057200 [Elysia marginata]
MRSPFSLEKMGQQCPGGVCLEVNINRQDGGDEPAVCTARVKPYQAKDRARKVRNPRWYGSFHRNRFCSSASFK